MIRTLHRDLRAGCLSRVAAACFALQAALVLATATAQSPTKLVDARVRMVREDVINAGIENRRVIAAIRETPRHLFVSPSQRHLAYYDMALPIGHGQTISPPFVVAYMTEALDPRPADRVLEIGTGSGYQAAVLSPLVADVYSIEIQEPLERKAALTLRRLGYENVHTKIGDGYRGWPEHAPFDKIIVTCSPERIPPALAAQLREGGRMVIPLGYRYQQTLYLFRKSNGKLEPEALEPTFFVPMTGRAEKLRRFKDESGVPKLINGSFEKVDDDDQPLGWYYVRQARVVSDGAAVSGKKALQFENETAGRGAQALQSLGVDGSKVQELDISVTLKMENVQRGQSARQLPRIELSFFDERRAPVGVGVLGPWYGTIAWTRKAARITVPQRARLAVLAVGMFGATGRMVVDGLRITPNVAPSAEQ